VIRHEIINLLNGIQEVRGSIPLSSRIKTMLIPYYYLIINFEEKIASILIVERIIDR